MPTHTLPVKHETPGTHGMPGTQAKEPRRAHGRSTAVRAEALAKDPVPQDALRQSAHVPALCSSNCMAQTNHAKTSANSIGYTQAACASTVVKSMKVCSMLDNTELVACATGTG